MWSSSADRIMSLIAQLRQLYSLSQKTMMDCINLAERTPHSFLWKSPECLAHSFAGWFKATKFQVKDALGSNAVPPSFPAGVEFIPRCCQSLKKLGFLPQQAKAFWGTNRQRKTLLHVHPSRESWAPGICPGVRPDALQERHLTVCLTSPIMHVSQAPPPYEQRSLFL